MTASKSYTCKIDNSNWMRSHEQAHITLTSPTGKQKTFYKKHLNETNRAFMHRLAALPNGPVALTPAEMQLFANNCKAYFAK